MRAFQWGWRWVAVRMGGVGGVSGRVPEGLGGESLGVVSEWLLGPVSGVETGSWMAQVALRHHAA
jgi:hypothetical protein